MMFECPEVIKNIKELQLIFEMNHKVTALPDAEALEADMYTKTATIHGIERKEKEYGIYPLDTDSLEDRRYRIQTKENERLPYTIRTVKKKLDMLCGKDNYIFEVVGALVICRVGLSRKQMYNEIANMMEHIIPLNMLMDITLLYNSHKVLGRYTHKQLKQFSYKDLREEIFDESDRKL